MYACTFLLACRVVSFRVLTFRFTLHICLLQWSFPSLLCFYWPITLLFTSELWSDINSSASAWFYIDRLTCLFILTASITRHSDAGLGGGLISIFSLFSSKQFLNFFFTSFTKFRVIYFLANRVHPTLINIIQAYFDYTILVSFSIIEWLFWLYYPLCLPSLFHVLFDFPTPDPE